MEIRIRTHPAGKRLQDQVDGLYTGIDNSTFLVLKMGVEVYYIHSDRIVHGRLADCTSLYVPVKSLLVEV